ncbi:MAG: HDOD domain-containing protein [Lachnospiraceae bacterium]|nr:HDOD domain-containing protein [Lachnospiraceae bacterium]
MIATLIPLFNNQMTVSAYSVSAEKVNRLMNPGMTQHLMLDGAADVIGFEVIDNIGPESLPEDKEIFVELNRIALYADIEKTCNAPHERIVLVINESVGPEDDNVLRLRALKAEGFRLAIQGLQSPRFEAFKPILQEMDYIMLDLKQVAIKKAKLYFNQMHPQAKLCAVHVDSIDDYKELSAEGRFDLYEGHFFRMPVRESDTDISPMKANYLNLLNTVNEPDYDLTDAADVIGHDTALIMSLLGTVNRLVPEEVTGVRQAAALLGQTELKKWINTSVSKELCADKPNEIMRMSLIRAGFSENLAEQFKLAQMKDELFLMGLFSAVDIMLDMPMEDALGMVHLSEPIERALLHREGPMAPVLETVLAYEAADWQELARILMINNADAKKLYSSYLETLKWYRTVFV